MRDSLAVVDPEEPDDTHGRCGDVDDVRDAETDGEQYVPTSTNPTLSLLSQMLTYVLVDPETRAEFEERQKSSPMNGLLNGQASQGGAANFDAAAWLAGAPAKKQGQAAEKGVTR
ncbi:hypothetical protein V495_04632 [Pseudogymnoascus sp. VKM F-4514 (FW-929)]|nr:hypothetical protein V495_04632 [Pseudogymnoascus sp. VKM F-4514 (FW-929)]